MTHPDHHDHPGEDDDRLQFDVSAGLRAALDDRPAPPPTWDLQRMKSRGRRRRTRARAVPVVAGLLLVAGAGAVVATTGAGCPWNSATTTVAPSVGGDPDQVVRDYLAARRAGDNARAFDDYWVPGVGARIDVTGERLSADRIDVGAPHPEPTGPGTPAQGWEQAVSVPVTMTWDSGPGLTTGKAPVDGQVVLVRDSDGQPWRIASSFLEPPLYSVPNVG
ncbi:hypothetical protein [Kineococcus sp. NPDC059986]|uniref:hypothetical protein n=1 Tax=Kineococcus sp. NPDC059986 TaxID=3155538 RepID=UPI00344E21FF